MGVGKITKRTVRELIEKIFVKKKRGNKNYLPKDKAAYFLVTYEIYGAHGLPRDIHIFTGELKQVIHDVGERSIGIGIKPSSEKRYARRLIQHVNINEEGAE